MKFLKLTLFLAAILVAGISFSQPICGFDGMHRKKMKEDPAYRKSTQEGDENIRRYIDKHGSQLQMRTNGINTALYTIPVVVHIVHTGGAIGSIYNPTDAQVSGAIDYLNQVYNGTYPGTAGVGDLQIQFALARRDPNCNPTNGINRVNGSGIAGYTAGGVNSATGLGTDELNVKNLIRWPVADYYNVWVVDKIDGKDGTSGTFIAGFAYFPTNAPDGPLYDGTIMLATQMKTGQKTLPHEIGHAFNLYHPFEGGDATICPQYSSTNPLIAQNTGDQVTDTDPITVPAAFACRTGTNTCTVDAGNPSGNAYSTNTESNYMNYTNCYTLFTAGQKARLLASAGSADRISLSSSLGSTPPTDALNPCSPKIDFEFSEGQATETSAATTGCRSYKDYTYNMVIGNDPSMPATATLSVSAGVATEGVDFDITTNGNFASPSKIVSFPSGSHAAQPFTIRIYDDAGVESTETFTLGFSVNNGGGNAVKGDGITSLVFTINDNDIAPFGPFTSTRSVGTATVLLQSPFSGASAKQKTQLIYKTAELNAAGIRKGDITGLSLVLSKLSGAAFVYHGLTIKMGQTTHATLYTPATEFPLNDASFTTVYSADYSTVNGLNSFSFGTPFTWDGVSNIVVEICYDNGAVTDADDNCQAYTDGIANSNYVFQNTINCTGSFSSFSLFNSGYKPTIQFVYNDPGTSVQTVLNSSKQEYLGPNADVYFYDQASGELLARINNSTAFDYGCTQVFIDRNTTSAGASSVPFWNNTPANYLLSKTIKVVPTTNNPSGSYQISLYYTQAETAAWQTATGQSISNAQVIKVSTQVSDVTPANPSGGGTVTLMTPSISNFGTNTVLTASFSNGFSGFGVGMAGTALPIQLLDFKGNLKAGSVVLDWSTTSETNSKNFEVERSYDGITFVKAGTVAASGNSSGPRYYSFTDPAGVQENNYYRLKKIDLDNRFEYSKVILIRNQNGAGNFRVINNPFRNEIDIDFGRVQAGKTEIKLLDAAGREIYSMTADATGQSRLKLNLAGKNISAGVYLLQVTINNEQFISRVVKQ